MERRYVNDTIHNTTQKLQLNWDDDNRTSGLTDASKYSMKPEGMDAYNLCTAIGVTSFSFTLKLYNKETSSLGTWQITSEIQTSNSNG